MVVDPSRRARAHLVGEFRPGQDAALAKFRSLVQSVYPPLPSLGPAEIDLQWGSTYRDLDLHLFICERKSGSVHHVGHRGSVGSVYESPWALRTDDVLEGPGIEQIAVSKWLDAEYHVLVHDYSGASRFPVGDVNVRLSIPDSGVERTIEFRGAPGTWWHVLSIDGATGRVDEINRTFRDCPFPI